MIPTTRAGLRELVDTQAEAIAQLVDENDQLLAACERWQVLSRDWSALSAQQTAQIKWMRRKLNQLAGDTLLLVELVPEAHRREALEMLETQWEIQRLDEVEP